MHLRREFYRLPFRFDVERLAEEALSFPESAWRAHPSGFEGNTALLLVSSRGGQNDDTVGPMKPTEHLAKCPYMRQALSSFGVVIGRSRLMRLGPGATVKEHIDTSYYWRSRVRIHIPVITNPAVEFYCGDKSVHMGQGESWIFDNWRLHRVENRSSVPRIHLVMDTVGTASFWDMVEQADGTEETFVPYDPAAAETELVTEQFSEMAVMPPAELDSFFSEILRDAESHPEATPEAVAPLRRLLDAFRQDWRAVWVVHGPEPEGWDRFRELVDRLSKRLNAFEPALPLVSNGFGAQQAIMAGLAVAVMGKQGVAAGRDRGAAADGGSARAARRGGRRGAAPPTAAPAQPAAERQLRISFDRPIFIVAAPRSGSTLLFETLAKHRGVWSLGDEGHQQIEGVPGLRPADRGFESNRLTAADAKQEPAAAVVRAMASGLRSFDGRPIMEAAGESEAISVRFLEKTPKNALRIPFLRALFPDALFVFLHRNPRDNLSSLLDSWRSQRYVTYPGLPDWEGLPWSHLLIPGWRELIGAPLAEVVLRQWIVTNETILADLEALPAERWTAVSHESFVADPAGELRRLCGFAGLPFGRRMEQIAAEPLQLSRYTLTPPAPDKWKKNAAELGTVLAAAEPLADRLAALRPKVVAEA